jgi:isoleucyl-tRNA synthetase
MVISTALFDKPAFKNLVVNGLVLAEDGKKMSKRLQNYPDPTLIASKYGADALRMYLLNSPVVRAEPLRFKESGVRDVLKDVLIPWFNSYRMFVDQSRRLERVDGIRFVPNERAYAATDNLMDRWIISALQSLIKCVREEMSAYRLDTVAPHLVNFLDRFSRWYLRFNKLRIKGKFGADKALVSLQIVFEVLCKISRLMAPFTPFFVEYMFQNLRKALPKDQYQDSVHYLTIPDFMPDAADENIERSVSRMQALIDLGRSAREASNQISFRFPYPYLMIVHRSQEFLDDIKLLDEYVLTELNVKELKFSSKLSDFISLSVEPNNRELGPALGKKRGSFCKSLDLLSFDDLLHLQTYGSVSVKFYHDGVEEVFAAHLDTHLKLNYQFRGDASMYGSASKGDLVVLVNKDLSEV